MTNMLKYLRQRWSYLALLSKENIGWKIITTIGVIWGGASFFRDEILLLGDESKLKVLNFALSVSVQWWIITMFTLLLIWIFESSYRASKKQRTLILELEKVDRDDLSRMLNGLYCENTFLYKGEHLCAKFKGKFEIDQLNVYTKIAVRAPKYSWASIRLQWTNGHPANNKYRFSILDQQGHELYLENIYQDHQVFVDEKSCFSIKFVHDESYVVHEAAELWIKLKSWHK